MTGDQAVALELAQLLHQYLLADAAYPALQFFNIGTPVKPWLGLPPTGVTVEYAEFAFHKVRDGRFYEMNYAMDVLDVQCQLAQAR
jgi:predicted ester cyclase